MSLTVAELAEEVRESNRLLTETIQRLADTVHDLEGAVRKLEPGSPLSLIAWNLSERLVGL
jgi:hypothetical protein